jgi:ketosteroid isomerase-like protein
MTENKRTVEQYMAAFRASDHSAILSCLTDDVVWDIPGMVHLTGKAAFDQEIENPAFVGKPDITVTRMVEEADVVVAEGTVRTQRRDGDMMNLRFCDVFILRDGKIRQLTSYLMEIR